MKIMDRVLKNTEKIWEDAVNDAFLSDMMSGKLDKERFERYIVQDSIYIRDYLKAFAMAMFKCRTIKDMQVFYSILGYVNDSENATRLNYLKDFGLTDDDVDKTEKLPECAAYTGFLTETAIKEDIPEILMAVMPCMVGYYIVWDKVKTRAPQISKTYYGPLVGDYTNEFYKDCCDYWTNYVNKVCEGLDEARLQKLNDIFVQASMHELWFWQMAGKK